MQIETETENTIFEQLCEETNTNPNEWEEMGGPETGIGIERWYYHKDGQEAYTVDDEGIFTIEVTDPSGWVKPLHYEPLHGYNNIVDRNGQESRYCLQSPRNAV
jgi:hypothetical protein